METKTYDIEVPKTTGEIYEQVHGAAHMEQASTNLDEMSKPKRDSRDNTKGLDVMTNARLSFMDRQKTYSQGWNESSLDLLEALFTESTKKAKAYAEAARKSRSKHRMLAIPTLIIASAATATSFFAAGNECDAEDPSDSDSLKISVAFLTSVTAVLGGVASLYSFDSKTTACIAASGSFDALAKKTQIQIFLTNELKGPVEVVINDVSAEFTHLVNTSPLL